MRSEKQASGLIDNSGRLKMYMGELNEFFKKHKGEAVFARFTVIPAHTSEALKGYYYKYVVPAMRDGFAGTGMLMTERETEKQLREMCPLCVEEEEENGRYTVRVKEIDELGTSQMCDFIEWLKVFAAENFNVYIEDPKNI